MGVLVDVNARFEIKFFYENLYENNEEIGASILKDYNCKDLAELKKYKKQIEEDGHIFENIDIFIGIFRPADHDEMSGIREDASIINHRNEKGMLWMKVFRPKVVAKLCTQWNCLSGQVDQEGNPMPLKINEINCGKMHEHILIEIVNRWAKKVGAFRNKNNDNNNIKD